MNDKIIKEIKNNNLEQARIEIKKLEDSLLLEKSDYMRCKLQEKIKKYKELYSKKMIIHSKDLEKSICKINQSVKDLEINSEILLLENKSEENINIKNLYSTGKIINCYKCIFNYFEIKESLVLENCTDCIINFKSRQCRIKNSKNIQLFCYIESGISLEDCKNIKISKNDIHDDITNKYKNVKDFTNPFCDSNYKFN